MVSIVVGSLATGLSGQSVMQQELERRRDSVIAAEEAIMAGDEAYQSSSFQDAVVKYRQAYAAIPAGDKTDKFRDAAKERYAQAAVQAARVMNRQGDRDGAIALVDEVLGETGFPDYFPAQKLRAQLDDPIRTNPAATKEHGQKIDEVRRLLYLAEGFFNLGDFDKSIATYQKVLQVDPYNKAARRGMERGNAKISDYADAARDHTRAELLSQVGSQWELKKNEKNLVLNNGVVEDRLLEGNRSRISQKLDSIVIPFIDFDDSTLEDAIEFLQGRSRSLDTEIVEENKGVDFVLNMGRGNSPEIEKILSRTFSLQLRNVPLRQVLDLVTRQTGTIFRVDRFAVVVQPAGGATDDLLIRRYSVPPNFLSQASSGGGGDGLDPFADSDDSAARLAPRLSARQFLEQQGIPFPDGASASFNSSNAELTVKTTSIGHDDVQQLVDAENMKEPVSVIIETRIVSILEENLEELDFDSALQSLADNGQFRFSGGTVGNARESDFIGGQPVTAGLRSGDFSTGIDPINQILQRESREIPTITTGFDGTSASSGIAEGSSTPALASAPGILSVVGQANDLGVSALMRGLQQKKGVSIMSKPSVITRSGQQATIESAREFIYPTEYEPPEVPNSIGNVTLIDLVNNETFEPSTFFATPSHPTAFETRKIGTVLEVQPTVSADRTYTDLAFNLRLDDFIGFINYGEPIRGGSTQGDFGFDDDFNFLGIVTSSQEGEVTPNDILMPLFTSTGLKTNVSVATGSTLVVGGIVSERVEDVQDKVPLLGSIPLLGKLFTSEALRREKRLVMVFVTVRIVDPAGNPVQN